MQQTSKKHVFHLKRVGLSGMLLLAFFIVRLDAGQLPEILKPPQVLAYATEISRSGLLAGTNSARSSQGLNHLSSATQLDNSAQSKAQDMVDKNYWAHVGPDGTEPWYFFNQAGYSYSRAGENLAYGFMSSQAVVDGWMNSSAHRDNMLGQYNDVGFGIINAPDFQGNGQQTLVVAHYGARTEASTPVASTAPSPPPPVSPQNSIAPDPTSTSSTIPEQSEPATEIPSAANEAADPVATPAAATASPAPVKVGSPTQVSVLSMLSARTVPLTVLFSLGIIAAATAGYALTHRRAVGHALVNGEHFVMAHPGFDTAMIAAVTTLVLMTTYGTIS